MQRGRPPAASPCIAGCADPGTGPGGWRRSVRADGVRRRAGGHSGRVAAPSTPGTLEQCTVVLGVPVLRHRGGGDPRLRVAVEGDQIGHAADVGPGGEAPPARRPASPRVAAVGPAGHRGPVGVGDACVDQVLCAGEHVDEEARRRGAGERAALLGAHCTRTCGAVSHAVLGSRRGAHSHRPARSRVAWIT